MALQFEGFTVATAADGIAALQAIEKDPPSLVILDVNMPCLDGWGVLRELGSNPRTKALPVIVVTGGDVLEATAQAAAILRKPLSPDDVLPLIYRQLSA